MTSTGSSRTVRSPVVKGHNEGSLYQRRSDGLWIASVSLPDGRRRSASSKDKAKARDHLRRLLRETGQGVTRTKRLTVAELLRSWLAEAVEPSALAPKTRAGYVGIVENHLVPLFGAFAVERLTPGAIADGLTRSATSPRSKGHHRAVLHSAFEWGRAHRLVPENPAGSARLPTAIVKDATILTLEQAMTVIEETRGEWLHALWLLFLTTGMRESEALGLTWDDVDLAAGRIKVVATLHRSGNRRDPWIRRPTKTRRERVVPLGAMVVAALTEQQRRLAEARQDDWRYFGHVFLNEQGQPYHGTRVLLLWYETLARLGLPRVKIHELRHTAASLMLSLGYTLEDVKQILGHSTIRVTSDVYSHPVDSRLREVAEGMDRALRRAVT